MSQNYCGYQEDLVNIAMTYACYLRVLSQRSLFSAAALDLLVANYPLIVLIVCVLNYLIISGFLHIALDFNQTAYSPFWL